MLIQFLIILFSLFAISRLFKKLRSKEVRNTEFYSWLFFWFLVIGATIWFKETDRIANFFGVEKGADLAVYVSVLFLFYLIFKLIVKVEKQEKEITKITREIALKK
ncbi:DUF2304 domain-containing protein [Candidatus Falkowbacteria bacterium]|jgi:hypothetical protein|nr:DUF2304 domain-containing protein [Candidatus Falkowbacteria bacterium]MBT4433225.1 DUF2304 domain-containing protein [Candidatus Falkowbacteria bacterium]